MSVKVELPQYVCPLPRGGDDGAGSGGQIGLCAFAVPLENWRLRLSVEHTLCPPGCLNAEVSAALGNEWKKEESEWADGETEGRRLMLTLTRRRRRRRRRY